MIYRVRIAAPPGVSCMLGEFTSEALARQAVRSVAAALASAKDPVLVAMNTRDGELFAMSSDAVG